MDSSSVQKGDNDQEVKLEIPFSEKVGISKTDRAEDREQASALLNSPDDSIDLLESVIDDLESQQTTQTSFANKKWMDPIKLNQSAMIEACSKKSINKCNSTSSKQQNRLEFALYYQYV